MDTKSITRLNDEAAAWKFWCDLNNRLEPKQQLTPGDIETCVGEASIEGLGVMTLSYRVGPENPEYKEWITLVADFYKTHNCKPCLASVFGEGFNESYARNPSLNIERVSILHNAETRRREQEKLTESYPINVRILEDIDAEMSLV